MATYNGEKFLEEQLDSILNQSFQDFELIICDDASSDSTVDIIHSYIKKFPNISLFQNIKPLGVIQNFKKAIRLAQTPYIALSDQDDIWHHEKLEILLQEMKILEESHKHIPLLVHSDLALIDENNQLFAKSFFDFKDYKFKENKDLSQMLGRCGVMGNTILMNRVLKEKALIFWDYGEIHDYTLALINELYGKRKTIYKPLVNYRIHDNNTSNSIENMQRNYTLSLSYFYKLSSSLPYRDKQRENLLEALLLEDDICDRDKKLMRELLKYLYLEESTWKIFGILIKYDFIRRGFFYRSKLFLRLLLSK
jgi:glycosyltransferase involved in cell wall biosynthesis